jgi:hypothetical protein
LMQTRSANHSLIAKSSTSDLQFAS